MAEDAPADNYSDHLDMPQEVADEVDRALTGVGDEHIASLQATAINVATGQLHPSALARRLVSLAGVSPEQAERRATFMMAAYQTQANVAVTHRAGVAESDLPDMWAWAREKHPDSLRDAVQQQMIANDFSGYRRLAERYMAANPPSRAAVEAGGLQTRKIGDQVEVSIDGVWMTLHSAARMGRI